jgi:hypothetical protein
MLDVGWLGAFGRMIHLVVYYRQFRSHLKTQVSELYHGGGHSFYGSPAPPQLNRKLPMLPLESSGQIKLELLRDPRQHSSGLLNHPGT